MTRQFAKIEIADGQESSDGYVCTRAFLVMMCASTVPQTCRRLNWA